MSKKLIEVSSLCIDFVSDNKIISAVKNVSFNINEGEVVALVGESGCGKSVTCLSLAKLIDEKSLHSYSGKILFYDGDLSVDIFNLSKNAIRDIRGNKIAYIFQEPSSSLNPVMKIGDQIAEVILKNNTQENLDIKAEVISLLNLVGIADPEKRLNSYPCYFSGGMQQRVMIAMALAGKPKILIADEPTTSLDVTIQSQIIELFKEIRKKTKMAILLVTHNLGIVSNLADKIMVMYAGNIVEYGNSDIFTTPLHPYTKALLNAVPKLGRGKERLSSIPGNVSTFNPNYKGCRFAERCQLRAKLDKDNSQLCLSLTPPDLIVSEGRMCKCHYA